MTMTLDGWRIDVDARTAQRDDCTEQLSPRAIRLLQVLAGSNGATLSRADLLRRVWPNVTVSDESLTQVVAELRRKLRNRELITTVSRGGYRLTAPIFREFDGQATQSPERTFSLDAYTLCLEAEACFARGGEGSQRAFVELAAQAAATAPNFARARAVHATALLKRHVFWSEGQMLLEKALEEAEAAIELKPDLASAHFAAAAIQLAIGWTEPGIKALETALSLAPSDAGIHLESAILAMSVGKFRAAAALATKSASLAPDQYGGNLLAARILMPVDPVRARACAERALRRVQAELTVDPTSMRALYALGPLLATLGDHRGARAALEGLSHHESPLEYYRALGFAQIGDASAAVERLDFLAARGWRHACILDKDNGFEPVQADRKFQHLRSELLAA